MKRSVSHHLFTSISFFSFFLLSFSSQCQSTKVPDFSGTYINESVPYLGSFSIDSGKEFEIFDHKGKKTTITVKRLVNKINVMEVSTYFYEVLTSTIGEKNQIARSMEVIYNSISKEYLLSFSGLSSFKRISGS